MTTIHVWLCHEGLALSRDTLAKRWDYCNAKTCADVGSKYNPELDEGAQRGN